MAKRKCFVIGPIGEKDSDIRLNADTLLHHVIEPALEPFNMIVYRGDHRAESNEIDEDVITSVRKADICIVDLTGLNPNVMYEFGRREESGKPFILLKAKGQKLPVDLQNKRCIEYDFTLQNQIALMDSIADTKQQIRNFMQAQVDNEFAGDETIPSLKHIGEQLDKISRKLDRLAQHGSGPSGTSAAVDTDGLPAGLDPKIAFAIGIKRNNMPLAEAAMMRLQQEMSHLPFLDKVVEIAAAKGSQKAGEMLIDCAQEFMDSDMPFEKKIEYLGCLITYAGNRDEEGRILELVEHISDELTSEIEMAGGAASEEDVARLHNQMDRLYYGMYGNTHDPDWLEKACREINLAIQHDPSESSYYYNRAGILMRLYDETGKENDDLIQQAVEDMRSCLQLEERPDSDHLQQAYRLFRRLDMPEADQVMAELEEKFPALAGFVKMNSD